MIARFSLYGFLKNCNFAEPFLILFYLSLGLSFFEIGLLIGFQGLCVNLLEIPSGAVADLYGRKRTMIFSLGAYIASFIAFFLSHGIAPLLAANFLFAIGEAFRTGTHKAIIFDWLRHEGRLDDRTRVYGHTRAWAKYGSAFSVVISTIIVILSPEYRWVFAFSILPYLAGIANLASYPAFLDARSAEKPSLGQIMRHTFRSARSAFEIAPLRRLIVRNMGFEGAFAVTKDYLQPILKTQALLIAAVVVYSEKTTTALVVGAVYVVLHLISAFASHGAHAFSQRFREAEKALLALIIAAAVLSLTAAAGLATGLPAIAIVGFVLYYLLDNLWRPIVVAQYDSHAKGEEQATILSIEAQAKTIGVMILAPIAGYLADKFTIAAVPTFGGGILFLLLLFSISTSEKEIQS